MGNKNTMLCIGRPSLLNHSCEPNCVIVFDGPYLHLRTIREIPPGEQVGIMYFMRGVGWPNICPMATTPAGSVPMVVLEPETD